MDNKTKIWWNWGVSLWRYQLLITQRRNSPRLTNISSLKRSSNLILWLRWCQQKPLMTREVSRRKNLFVNLWKNIFCYVRDYLKFYVTERFKFNCKDDESACGSKTDEIIKLNDFRVNIFSRNNKNLKKSSLDRKVSVALIKYCISLVLILRFSQCLFRLTDAVEEITIIVDRKVDGFVSTINIKDLFIKRFICFETSSHSLNIE